MSFDILKSSAYREYTPRRWYRLLAESVASTVHLWEQVALLLLFGLLLLLVVLACTGFLSLSIACGLMAGLAVAALAILWPQFVVWLIFLGAGLPSLLLPVPGHTMRPIEAPLFLCFAVIVIRRPGMRLRLPHVCALLFMAIALISFLHVPSIASGLSAYGANKELYAWLLNLLALFGGTFLARYIKNLSTFFCLILLTNLPYLLIGVAQALHIHLPTLLVPSTAIEVTQEGRLSGPADSPTTFAFYLIDLLAVALVCWTLGVRRRHRLLGALLFFLITWELIGSGTRSAAGAAIVMVIVTLLATRRFKWLLALIVLGIPLSIVSLNTILPKFLHNTSSISNRLFLWQQALKLIFTHPWIGIGLEQFPTYYAKFIVGQADRLNPAGISVHNQYLELALESGIFWLLVALCLLISLALVCWKLYKRAERQHRLPLLATLLLVLAFLIISFVDVPFDKPEGAVFFLLIAGLALGYPQFRQREKSPRSTEPSANTLPPQTNEQKGATWNNEAPAPGPGGGLQPGTSITLRLPRPYRRTRLTQDEPYIPLPGQLQAGNTLSNQLTAPMPRIRTAGLEEIQNAPKTGRAVIIQIISWAIAIPIIFPSTALMTRYFGPVQYGEYSFALSILALCALGTMTGMDSWLIRHLSRQKRAEWGESLGYAAAARLLTSLLVSGLAALLIWFLPLGDAQKTLLLLGVGTLTFSFSFNCLRAIYECGFVAEQQMSTISLLTTINRVTTAGLIVLAVLLHFSLIWAYLLMAYSDLPFFLILLFIAHKRFQVRLRFHPARIWEIVRASLPFTGYDALAFFSGQVDVLLLLPLAGSLSVGIYALALRITNPLLNIAFAYVGGLYPYLCTRFVRGEREFAQIYREATRVLALGIVPLTVFVVVEAPQIVALLAGNQFTAAVLPTRLLMIALALTFFSQLTLRACMAANRERIIPLISAVTLVIALLANALLIPHWQAIGASIASLLAELTSVCLFSIVLIRSVKLWQTLNVVLRVVLGNIPALAFLLWQPALSLPVLAIIAGLLALAGCVVTRTLSWKDVQMARQIVSTRLERKKESA